MTRAIDPGYTPDRPELKPLVFVWLDYAEILRETAKARHIRFEHPDGPAVEFWVPKSQMRISESGRISLARWLYDKHIQNYNDEDYGDF